MFQAHSQTFFCGGGEGGGQICQILGLLWLRVDYLAIALDLANFFFFGGGGSDDPPDPTPWLRACCLYMRNISGTIFEYEK